MKHIIITLLIGMFAVSCANVNPKVYKDISEDYNITPAMQPVQVGEEVYLKVKEQARIQEIQYQLFLLNELISESQDTTFINQLIDKYTKLADSLPPTEQVGAYLALTIAKQNK